MSEELDASEQAAREGRATLVADRVSVRWFSACCSLALLARSIVEPLRRLAEGTREVSAGRFDYRLESAGGTTSSRRWRATSTR